MVLVWAASTVQNQLQKVSEGNAADPFHKVGGLCSCSVTRWVRFGHAHASRFWPHVQDRQLYSLGRALSLLPSAGLSRGMLRKPWLFATDSATPVRPALPPALIWLFMRAPLSWPLSPPSPVFFFCWLIQPQGHVCS